MLKLETRHALRALTALAGHDDGPVTLAELAGESLTPAPMLAKVLHRLNRLGLVTGRRGRGGGYRLTRPAGNILLSEVIAPLEGSAYSSPGCLFGLPRCRPESPCPLHAVWEAASNSLRRAFDAATLSDLASGVVSTPAAAPGAPSTDCPAGADR